MGFFSGGKSKTETVPVDLLSKEQHELLTKLTDLYNTTSYKTSTGDYTAPPMHVDTTQQEQDYYDFVNKLAQSSSMQNILSGTVPYEVGNDAAQRLYEESIRPAYLRELEEVVMPAIKEGYAGPTYYGSSRGRATTQAAQDTAQRMSEAYAQLMYNEELAKRTAMENAYGRVLGGASTMGGFQAQAGDLSRMIAQERVAADLQRYLMGEAVRGDVGTLYQNPIYDPSVALAMNLLGVQTHGIGTKTTTTSPGIGHTTLSSFGESFGKSLGEFSGDKLKKLATGGTTS